MSISLPFCVQGFSSLSFLEALWDHHVGFVIVGENLRFADLPFFCVQIR
jgi:hypothetical protein